MVLDTIKTRRSCRKYKSDMVPDEAIQKIAEAGTYAATGKGAQSPLIIVVKDKAIRDQLSAMNAKVLGASHDPFFGAPVCIVVLADRSRPTYLYDGSLVIGNMMLASHALGLGSCWIHRAKEVFATEEGKALLAAWGIEGDYEGIGHCVVGYADCELAAPAARKPDYIRYI